MMDEGFNDVSQLHGGVVTYGKDDEVKGELWDGKLYVFDERISVPVNRTDEDIVVGKCHYCGEPKDRYINCAYPSCNKKTIAHTHCEEKHNGFCSSECETKSHEMDEVVG